MNNLGRPDSEPGLERASAPRARSSWSERPAGRFEDSKKTKRRIEIAEKKKRNGRKDDGTED
jgi:hypothetical protein